MCITLAIHLGRLSKMMNHALNPGFACLLKDLGVFAEGHFQDYRRDRIEVGKSHLSARAEKPADSDVLIEVYHVDDRPFAIPSGKDRPHRRAEAVNREVGNGACLWEVTCLNGLVICKRDKIASAGLVGFHHTPIAGVRKILKYWRVQCLS